ncbi:MAG: KpsF/GutQ family sugar-phosphate isomerase [Lunatimonas sp.]|uniref:KpsF/GutQ family sugar-phosphate isomerase n=1 Tax=Lunatimonas sp. TaxID=2060141 RepID=UPI00263BB0D6|nr:KpsF/GutQ family sugar-phosphate isomerase [Lunatimonas sp.]MCC5939100.1 KpsF/GutQ family sugar-phosphate isomerase [Lunatimonas sp.]
MKLTKNIKFSAIKVLQNEAEAINGLIDHIDEQFEEVIGVLLGSSGRVVVTGIGKSAIIASKIVATLNSTGTPSLFLHAADAIHGDLGMIKQEDVVICISKSGNTPEIKVLVPLLKQLGSKLIALVSQRESYLAEHADYVLFAGFKQEACPNNLAPTTSTAVHMALGDALAVCLLEARGFTADDFARYHPGGSLGKQLYMTVGDLVAKNQRPSVGLEADLREVIVEISSKLLGATVVVDQENTVRGIITDGDLRRMLVQNPDLRNVKAKDIMTINPKTIAVSDYAIRSLNKMKDFNITQLVALEDGNYKGFVHIHDLMKEGIV